MSDEKTQIREALDAQLKLKEAILTKLSYINVTLDDPAITKTDADELRDQRDILVKRYNFLRVDSVQIIAAETAGDLETINAVSADVQKFIRTIKQVSKAIKVIAAFVVFVSACILKDPKSIADAAVALYKAINEKIAELNASGAANIAPLVPPESIKGLMKP